MALTIDSKIRMNSGYEIPRLGYGVYQTPASVTHDVVKHALSVGYRHVDSAVMYGNEEPCGTAIRESTLPRSSIFFTSKIPPRSLGYDNAKRHISETLQRTGFDYVDLYLIHAPFGGKEARLGAWKAMVEAHNEGKIRSLGVSNYGVHHLNELEEYIKETDGKEGNGKGGVLSVGQWEVHPWLMRGDITSWCKERGVVVEAYCPLVRAERMHEKTLVALAEKYKKTPAQVLVRWSLQKGFVPLPKSVTPSRIEENSDVYDFEMTDKDIATLDTNEYSSVSWDPTTSHD